jgi:pimeloyl-ACP methyl ester carboxylesterase
VQRGQTQYARSGDVSVAFQIAGDGPVDLVVAPPAVSNVELAWEQPLLARFYESLAAFARLLIFDKRGTGLSDRVKRVATLEERADDIRAVMDAAGSERAVVFGASEGGSMAVMFAASHPGRTAGLVLYGTHARGSSGPGYPWRPSPEEWDRFLRDEERNPTFGTPARVEEVLRFLAPSVADDEAFKQWHGLYYRMSTSPGAQLDQMRMNSAIDVSDVLGTIRVPTLVLQRAGDRVVTPPEARWMTERIPGARYVELGGDDHLPFVGDADSVVAEIERFVRGLPEEAEFDRVLATVLFTDIVDSTARAVELGDRRWRDLVTAHNDAVRRELVRFRGRELDTAGDGFFATFDGPARAIRCAYAATAAVRELGLEIRAGLHRGSARSSARKSPGSP